MISPVGVVGFYLGFADCWFARGESVLFEQVQAGEWPPVDLHKSAAFAQWPDIDWGKAEFVED